MLWMLLHFLQPRCGEEARGKQQPQEAQNRGTGGRGQAREDGWGTGSTVPAKGELNSRPSGSWVATGPLSGTDECPAACRPWQPLPCCCRCPCCGGHHPHGSGHL